MQELREKIISSYKFKIKIRPCKDTFFFQKRSSLQHFYFLSHFNPCLHQPLSPHLSTLLSDVARNVPFSRLSSLPSHPHIPVSLCQNVLMSLFPSSFRLSFLVFPLSSLIPLHPRVLVSLCPRVLLPFILLILPSSPPRRCSQRPYILSSLVSRLSSFVLVSPCPYVLVFLSSFLFSLCANHCAATLVSSLSSLNFQLSTFNSRLSPLVPPLPSLRNSLRRSRLSTLHSRLSTFNSQLSTPPIC